MKRTFLHTQMRFNDSTGVPVRTFPDCDSTPVVKIYSTSDVVIETPTISSETVYFATGHYSYPLDWRYYTAGNWYYEIVTYIYNSQTMVTDRRYFQYPSSGTTDGDNADGYNNNLGYAMYNTLTNDATIVSLLGHSESTPKIFYESTIKDEHPSYPYMTYDVVAQRSIDDNLMAIRDSQIEVKVYDEEDDALLRKILDRIVTYFKESNNYHGIEIDTADDVFHTMSVREFETIVTPKGLVYWDKDKNRYEIGAKFMLIASIE